MEFEFTGTMYIEDNDLEKMYNYVKNGGDFDTIFDDITCGYDDGDYYTSYYIRDEVEKEIKNRIEKSEKSKENRKKQLIKEIENVVDNKLTDSIIFYMTEYKDVADYYFIADIFKNKCAYLAVKIANELIEADEED